MCTVSYIPLADGYLLTSSRDEFINKETLPPISYSHFGNKITYPKDVRSGGTWIAGSNNETVVCLLNGAFEKHQKKPTQVTSRGKMVIQSLEYDDVEVFIDKFDFNQVEPFTFLKIKDRLFYELRWNGESTFLNKLDKDKPKIWSSPTLYTPKQRIVREKWFLGWLITNSEHPDFNIMGFHNKQHGDDKTFDILMKRPDGMQTVSITQIHNSRFAPSMTHLDLKTKETYGPSYFTV
ncbi:NRDE family protein [Cyclobacterium qasimii]|uniref:Transport and Golgi organization protein 2 n=2 Tax=Cyclobacterium qasimii TaxID=1350429 RepID=S7VQS4_9BACT|nr:NRDE family protein [Cyclobacterium qasimii]EPR71687.1 hypothetical protein ADICYQ_0158 [Cyclobacterium qasimii M12-11B]GEO22409.1 hypothetical protein CQA01_29430 [Cyclobacterium qasimii]